MKSIQRHGTRAVAGLAAILASSAMAAPVFQLSNVALDGTPGENTFGFASNADTTNSYITKTDSALSITALPSKYAYVASYFASQTLTSVGDKLTLSFTASLSNRSPAELGFRIGLYNSGGAKVQTNNFNSAGDTSFSTNRGYRASYREDNSANSTNVIDQRTGSDPLLIGSGAHTTLSSPSLPALNVTNGTPFTGTFTLEKTAAGTLITTLVNGKGPQSVTDTISPFTTFDTLALFTFAPSGGASNTLTLTSLSVSYAPIPEPTTFVFFSGLGATGLLMRRRNRGN